MIKEDLKKIYTNNNPQVILELEEDPYILNRILSFNHELVEETQKTNRLMWRVDKKLLQAVLWAIIPKKSSMKFYPVVKKQEEEQSEWNFLLEKVKKRYEWSEKDLEQYSKLLIRMWQNKEVLREYFRFYGIEEKYYKKYGLEFKKLRRWF